MNLKTSELLNENLTFLDVDLNDKESIFKFVSLKFKDTNSISSAEEFIKALNERESLGSTFMGNSIAIPHGKSRCVYESSLSFIKLKQPIMYESNDDSGMIDLIFTFAIPKEKEGNEYLKLLSNLARLLMRQEFINSIRNANSFDEVLCIFRKYDND